MSALRRALSAVLEDVGEIWSNRRAARHIGRMTVEMGLRRRASDGPRGQASEAGHEVSTSDVAEARRDPS